MVLVIMIKCNKLFILYSNLLIILNIINCQTNNETVLPEEKIINILNPILVEKLWNRKSCLTYRARIGTCLTRNECHSIEGKVGGLCLGFNLFCCHFNERTVPRFSPNWKCITNSNKTGICLKETDCRLREGIPDGFCGSHNNVCCLLETICGKYIARNETEIVNDFYPKPTFDSSVCQMIIERQPNVCQIRFDFLEFELAQPDSKGRCTVDALIIKTPVGEQIPNICGNNTGQHLYVESGRNAAQYGGPIKMSFVLNGVLIRRKWRIKIVMIPCDSFDLAPNGCLQYLSSVSGIVRSFNYGEPIYGVARYLSDLSYTVCIRPEENYCYIEWSLEYPDSFSFGTPLTLNESISEANMFEDRCTWDDFITIDDGLSIDKSPEFDRICGQTLSKQNYLFSQSKPFFLKVWSNKNQKPNVENSQFGFSIVFRQIPCTYQLPDTD